MLGWGSAKSGCRGGGSTMIDGELGDGGRRGGGQDRTRRTRRRRYVMMRGRLMMRRMYMGKDKGENGPDGTRRR
eukprot:747479-Hanusia_phi.AAC.5